MFIFLDDYKFAKKFLVWLFYDIKQDIERLHGKGSPKAKAMGWVLDCLEGAGPHEHEVMSLRDDLDYK